MSEHNLDPRTILRQRAADSSISKRASALLLSAHAYLVRASADEEFERFLHEYCGEGLELNV